MSAYIRWSKEQDDLVKKFYPNQGSNIPGLLRVFTRVAITNRAGKLGVKRERGEHVVLDDRDITYSRALRLLGVKQNSVESCEAYEGLTPQQCIDRLRRMRRKSDDGYISLVASAFECDSDYLHIGNELWSITVYHDYTDATWSVCNVRYRMRARGLSADEALKEVLCSKGFRYTKYEDNYIRSNAGKSSIVVAQGLPGRSFQSVLKRAKILGVELDTASPDNVVAAVRRGLFFVTRRAYIGVDGKTYCYAVCAKCGRILVVAKDDILLFRHSEDFCTEHALPEEFCDTEDIRELLHEMSRKSRE